MNLSCTSRAIKYLMLVFNLIFVITGIILLAVGVSVKAYYYSYNTFLDDKYFSLPNLLIATGTIIFFVAFLGCCGAIKENWIMLIAFSGFLIVIFIFEFSAGIAGYVLRDKTASYLETKLNESMYTVGTNPQTQVIWDAIQDEFECCGITKYTDWQSVFPNGSLPISCCPRVSGTVGSFYCNAGISQISNRITESHNVQKRDLTALRNDTNSTSPASSTTDLSSATSLTNTTLTMIPPSSTTDLSSTTSLTNTTSTMIPPSTSSPYATGCKQAFGDYLRTHAVQIGGCAMAIAVIQFIGILFSCHLARQLKNGYYST